jgi:molybdate transport system substrate-binding protein
MGSLRLRRPLTRALLTGLLAVCAACTSGPSVRPSSVATTLTVYAAASLKAVLGQAITAYEAGHGTIAITLATDSSAALATQIQQGAPADLFLSADTASPQRLIDGGLAVAPVRPFARNQLVVIVAGGNPGHVATPLDLGRPGLKVVAAGDAVPISMYAAQLVRNLAAASPSAGGLEAGYDANVVSKEDNVAAVVSKIALGEGDAAIVYATDAGPDSKVDIVPIPAAVNVVATYGGVVVQASPNRAAAGAFLDWLAGPDGQAILGKFGFLPPP